MTRLLLIDDDDTTREVLGLLLRADGWEVIAVPGGEEAVSAAALLQPDAVLSDLQMPGLCGADLVAALQSACGEGVPLVAMTATPLPGPPDGYQALLVKPFAAGAVRDALRGASRLLKSLPAGLPVLAAPVFTRLKDAMPAAQLRSLYEFALQDADARVSAMEAETDHALCRREAHALKGSCGMIGAARLGALAAVVEERGLPESSMQSKLFSDFRGEISAVRRMLEELLAGDS